MATVRITVHYKTLLDISVQSFNFDEDWDGTSYEIFNGVSVPIPVAGYNDAPFAVPNNTRLLPKNRIERVDWQVL